MNRVISAEGSLYTYRTDTILVHALDGVWTSNVVISSDGSLYKCEDCTPGFSFGNVEDGITDAERLRWYEEYGATRKKCRHCVFLPECTSFSRCPMVDRHCQKVRNEIQKRVMRQIIAKKAKDEEVDEGSLSISRTC